MFTCDAVSCVTAENQYTKSSLEVMMMERTVATFASWVCYGW